MATKDKTGMEYIFESDGTGTVWVEVVGEYVDGSVDICASHQAGEGGDEWFYECDDADEIMAWLVSQGVEFESRRSMAFNRAYIQHVLIEGDATLDELLDEAAGWTDEQIERKLQFV